MTFEFGIIGFPNINDNNLIQGALSDMTGDPDTFVGRQLSFSSVADGIAQTADGDFPDDGGATLTAALTINGVTYDAGANIETDWEFITVDPDTGYYFRVTGLYIWNQPVGVSLSRAWDVSTGQFVAGPSGVYAPGTVLIHVDGNDLDGPPNFRQFTTDTASSTYGSPTGMRNDATLGLSNGTITCFASGTLIKTISGEVPIESLWVDDLVLTVDRGYRPIRWIRSRKLDSMDLRLNPDLRPIRIRTGALGGGMPEQDLMISPQHRVLVNSRIAESMFGTREVLVAARQLLVIEGIDVAEDITELDYWHFLFDDHEIVFSNGAKTESLYTGAEALESIGSEARKEIFTLFPDLEHRNVDEGPRSARPMIRSRDGRRLAQRHVKNQINLGLNG